MKRLLYIILISACVAGAASAFFLGPGSGAGNIGPGWVDSGFDPGDAVLLESGDTLLLENGDKLLLE